MKKNILVLACLMGYIGLMTGQSPIPATDGGKQDLRTMDDLLNSYQNIGVVTGDINDYFSPQEQRQLNEHFKGEQQAASGVNNPLSRGGSSVTIFGESSQTANLVSFDPATPWDVTLIDLSPSSYFENAGAIDPNDESTAYVIDSGGDFYRVNLESGAYTLLGNIPPPNAEAWSGAEFDPLSGDLFALSTNTTTSTLSVIDIVAVTSTTLGFTGMEAAISLMIDEVGDAYSHDLVDDNLYYVDLANGASTIIGPLGFDANFGQGGTYIKGDPGFAYLSAYNGGAAQSEWRRVDLQTGNSTFEGILSFGADQLGWCVGQGEFLAVPENALEDFSYVPNPTNGVLSLKSLNKIDTVSFFNLLGQRMGYSEIGSTTTDINISGLTTGTYIMKVTVDGKMGTYKVVKK